MIKGKEHLELSAETYQLVEQMAQARKITPSELVADLVRRFQAIESLSTLRQEYQRLTEKALLCTITRTEEKQMATICTQINALNQQGDSRYQAERRDRQAEDRFAMSAHLLELVHQNTFVLQSKRQLNLPYEAESNQPFYFA